MQIECLAHKLYDKRAVSKADAVCKMALTTNEHAFQGYKNSRKHSTNKAISSTASCHSAVNSMFALDRTSLQIRKMNVCDFKCVCGLCNIHMKII